FSGAGTLSYAVTRDGFIYGITASSTQYAVTLGTAAPSLEGASTTHVIDNQIWNASITMSALTNNQILMRHQVKAGDIIYVKTTATTTILVIWLAFPAT